MKQSKEVVDRRRKKILEMITKVGDIKVNDIAEHFQVSIPTIRRDLQYLDDSKYIERYYGGAHTKTEPEPVNTPDLNLLYKIRIAQYAASLIEDGDSVFINTSSTALEIISYIEAKNVTVITNNGNAIFKQHSSKVNVLLTGGELRHIKGTMVGDFALRNLSMVTAKKSFIGCSGLTIKSGMTTELLNEVKINELMNQRVSGSVYIVTDSTKLGKERSFVSCPIKTVKNIITDERASPKMVDEFENMGIHMHLVRLDDTSRPRKV